MSEQLVDLQSRATLLANKLDRLSVSIQNQAGFNTQEAYMAECARVLQNFYNDLHGPFFRYEPARRDNTLNPTTNSIQEGKIDYDYNLVWDQLLDNLIVLFLEMENLESISISNFNFAITEANRLISKLSSISSKLGDYILYSKNTLSDVFLAKDSFNDLSKIEPQSSLLSEEQCGINQEEGIVTLPVNTKESKVISVEEAPQLNDDSNGVSGNNHEIGKNHNGNIATILDNNPDTWYEYERVVERSSENEPPLVLDMLINLGTPQICNQVIVNPNNFGTKTVLLIDKIETSLDGQTYTSIKDDIPISGYEIEKQQEAFTLAPSTSQFAGQGIYTITPR